jgi:hypothetical protein
MWNKNICLSNKKTIFVIIIGLVCTLALASVLREPENIIEVKEVPPSNNEEQMWIPTEEDIAYQDSMYQIIQTTQNDIDTIKQDIIYILERLDYADGTSDSIRYVKDGKIDKRRN